MSKCAEFKFDLVCDIIFDKFFPGLTRISQIRSNLNSAHSDIIHT